MYRLIVFILLLSITSTLLGQVRYGWRSVYDTSGRLSRMNYYVGGVNCIDSNYYFQYHTDNILKGIVKGEITREDGCKNGCLLLFSEEGAPLSYNIRSNGQTVFSTTCDLEQSCLSSWVDQFDARTNSWETDSSYVSKGQLVLCGAKSFSVSLFKSPMPYDIHNDFVLKTNIPKVNNSSRIGVVLGWKDSMNYVLFEILYGDYFSVVQFNDGEMKPIGKARVEIGKKNQVSNEIKITHKDQTLIFEINQNIEMVVPFPDFKGEKVGLISRSKGDARFDDFIFQYMPRRSNPLLPDCWIGQGTGFFISSSGKILTTYDAVEGVKKIRVKGVRNGKSYTVPAVISRLEEDKNLAVLQVEDPLFSPFDSLPFGYNNRRLVSESSIFTLGFPNAISGIATDPEVFSGKALPMSSSTSNILMELPFRYGMIGAPVFDSNANLVGIIAGKGEELRYTEVIDYVPNSRLLKGYFGSYSNEYESPLKYKSPKDLMKDLSEIVVIIESKINN